MTTSTTTNTPTDWPSCGEFAQAVGATTHAIYRWRRRGLLRCHRTSIGFFYDRGEVERVRREIADHGIPRPPK